MTDEKYEFVTDIREKKNVARSARGRRTHCGKGGWAKLPSDNMTNKEWKAMNGKVESYRLNEPMAYEEFKNMPGDLRVMYVKALIEKFNVPISRIAQMLGVSEAGLRLMLKDLGFATGPRSGKMKWDQEGWAKWCNGVKTGDAYLTEEEIIGTEDEPIEAEPENEEIVEADAAEEITAPVNAEGPGRCVMPNWERLYHEAMAEKEKMVCEAAYLKHQRDEAWRELEVLRAKVEMVELIFGKKACA